MPEIIKAGGGSGDAVDIALADAGGYYTTDNVEAALQELGADVGSLPTDYIAKTVADANSVLYAVTDNTPAALAMGASTILARLAAGNIVAATPAELRTLLSLVPGTNVQEYDAELAALAGLTSAADKGIQFTGSGTAGLFDLTSAGKELLDDASATAQLATLGVIGGPWTILTKAADESRNTTTTAAVDTHLAATLTSATVYEIYLRIVYASPAGAGTPDLKLAFGEDTTKRGSIYFVYRNATDGEAGVALGAATNSALAAGTAAANRAVTAHGWYVGTGASAGVYWAQNTSDGNNTTVRQNSIFAYRAIG